MPEKRARGAGLGPAVRGMMGDSQLKSLNLVVPKLYQVRSTLEFFTSGSMAQVMTLLGIVGILMLRPQGLFALKVRK